MILYILFGQRKERYEGEYAPEALEVCDEYTMDENPAWLGEKKAEYEKDSSFVALEVVEVDMGGKAQDAIRGRLVGRMTISATLSA